MKKIFLSQNKIAIVDDWWFDYLMQWKWCASWNPTTKGFYAMRVENKKTIYMARVVAKTPNGMYCDHIFHRTLDNRESQLRNVTYSQSSMNRKTRCDNKLGRKGIFKFSDRPGFRAQLVVKGDYLLCKTFQTLDEAIEARRLAEERHFGEFSSRE